jgi:hypothetical protein
MPAEETMAFLWLFMNGRLLDGLLFPTEQTVALGRLLIDLGCRFMGRLGVAREERHDG